MTGRTVRATVDKEALKKHLSHLSYREVEQVCNMTEYRFQDCMKKGAKHKLSDSEIVMISIKFNIPIDDFVKSETSKLDELKRIVAVDKYLVKEYVRTSKMDLDRPFALNCSEMLSPVEIVKALPNVVDFEHWHKLPESVNPHIEFKIDGMVAFRYENGNAILFTNEYIKPDVIADKMYRIKQWGLNPYDEYRNIRFVNVHAEMERRGLLPREEIEIVIVRSAE